MNDQFLLHVPHARTISARDSYRLKGLDMRKLLVVFAFALLSGCSTLPGGVPSTRSFNDYAGDTILTVDSVVTTTRSLLAIGKITPDDADNVLKGAETARDGVKVARQTALSSGDAAGTARLRVAATAIDQLGAYLASKKGL